jgi:hypothetical protein
MFISIVYHVLWALLSLVVGRGTYAVARVVLGQDPADWVVLKVRGRHPRRWADVIRWGMITLGVILVWGIVWGTNVSIAAFQPHEGDAATPVISVTETTAHPRDPNTGLPFFADVYFKLVGDRAVTDACYRGFLSTAGNNDQAEALNVAFRQIEAVLRGRLEMN